MSARGYMCLGFWVAAAAAAAGLFRDVDPIATWMAFAGGALFGKGYGVWEIRQERRK